MTHHNPGTLLVEVRCDLFVHDFPLFDQFFENRHDRVHALLASGGIHFREKFVDFGILSFCSSCIF
jgi:hypothetical protein